MELEELCALAFSSAGIDEGHVAIEFVDEDRSRELNREYRRIDDATDVLSFGVDEDGAARRPAGARRHRDLPAAHRGHARGRGPRRAAPERHGSRDR